MGASTSPSYAPSTSSDAGGGLGDDAWIFDTAAQPVDLGITLDAARKVEAVIPVGGGSISGTGSDGTMYTLVIPENALLTDTTIGLTPVASLDGLPFGSDQVYAVQLSPDGLFLYSPAVLTIAPAQPIPAGEQIPFGYLADGRDVILAEPVLDSADIAIRVPHFSGNGVTRGLLADTEPDRLRIGGDAERRLAGAVSDALVRSRQNGDPVDVGRIEAVMLQYERDVIEARVAAAGQSCAKARLAIESVMSLERQRSLLAIESNGIGLDKYPGLVETGARICVLEEFELCVEEHVVHRMAMVVYGFQREFALLTLVGIQPDDAVIREAMDLARTCLTFRLKMESTGTLTVAGGGYTSTVTSEIILRFDPAVGKLSGDGSLVNEAFEYRAPCGATGITGGGTIEVRSLKFLTARPDQFNSDDLNLMLSYLPGPTSESARIKSCPPIPGEVILPPSPLWTTVFLGTHISELDAIGTFGGGYIAIDWEVLGNEYFARKEWIKEASGGGGTLVEAGTFKLYHTPGA